MHRGEPCYPPWTAEEDSPDAHVHNELLTGIREGEDRCQGEALPQPSKCQISIGRTLELDLRGDKGMCKGSKSTNILNSLRSNSDLFFAKPRKH